MVKYSKKPSKEGVGPRFTKNGLFIKESKVPPEVLEELNRFATEVDYDDKPELARCLFDEAYRSRQRYYNGTLYNLCEWHYQHSRLGQIAEQVAYLEKEAEAQPKAIKKKKQKRTKKTALSALVD